MSGRTSALPLHDTRMTSVSGLSFSIAGALSAFFPRPFALNDGAAG